MTPEYARARTFRRRRPSALRRMLRPRQQIPQNRLNPRRNPKRPTRQFRLPRAPLRPPPNLTAIPPQRSRPLQFPNRRWLLLPESPGPFERGLAERGAAEPLDRGGDGRRSPDRRSPWPEPPARRPAAVSKAATSNAAASSDARAPGPSLLHRLAVKSILDNLRRPEARVPAPDTVPTPGATSAASAAPDATAKAVSPASGLRDKLGVFTADRMQARRDAEEVEDLPGRDRCSCLAAGAGTAGGRPGSS